MEGQRRKRLLIFTRGIAFAGILTVLFGWQVRRAVIRGRMRVPLFIAVRNNDEREVKRLLTIGADPNSRDVPFKSGNWFQVMKTMVWPDKLEKVTNYPTILMTACDAPRPVGIVKMLIDRGADVNAAQEGPHTALLYAAEKSNTETIRLLLEHRANASTLTGLQQTALMLACANKNVADVAMLLQNGVKVNSEDLNHDKAIIYAVKGGRWVHIDALIRAGADPNTISPRQDDFNENDSNPRHILIDFAISRTNVELLKLLVAYGADVNKRGSDDHSALTLAFDHAAQNLNRYYGSEPISTQKQKQLWAKVIFDYLLSKGADPNIALLSEPPLLLRAVECHQIDLAKSLLNAHANLEKTWHGKTVLQSAVISRDPAMVRLLLSYRPALDNKDTFGVSPLMTAYWNGDLDIADLLLKAGAKSTIGDSRGRPGLWYRADRGILRR